MLARLDKLKTSLGAFGTRYRVPIFIFAAIGFVLGLVYTGSSLDLSLDNIVIGPLLIVMLATQPLLIFLNSLELKLCGDAVQAKLSISESVFISCSATVANILPLPAGLIVRGGALVQRGGKLSLVSKVLFAAALMWVGVALTVSLAAIAENRLAIVISLLGLTAVTILVFYVRQLSSMRIALSLFLIRLLMVAVFALQLQFCFAALEHLVTLRAASIYVASGIAGAVVSIVPAGLGIIESFGALLAKVDGASPAMAYIVLSLSRFIGLALAGIAMLLFSRTAFSASATREI